jgi:hypothetical protein
MHDPPPPAFIPSRPEPDERPRLPSGTATARTAAWTFGVLSAVLLLLLGGLVGRRWVESNLLRAGVDEVAQGRPAVSHAELLQTVRAFELATVKQTYTGTARLDTVATLAAGPRRVTLPGWVAGQELDARGRVTVTAGVDLARLRPEDIQVVPRDGEVQVVITLPPPRILGAELVPDTLALSSSAGLVTRMQQAVGAPGAGDDLRARAADEVTRVARDTALDQGVLDTAGHEAEQQLKQFLDRLPRTSAERVTYVVVARRAAGS